MDEPKHRKQATFPKLLAVWTLWRAEALLTRLCAHSINPAVCPIPSLGAVMNRLLLTLLALVAGCADFRDIYYQEEAGDAEG